MQLLAAAAGGERAAFDQLVEAHQAAVHRFIRTLVQHDDVAEDALQETFLAAYRGAAGFRGDGRVRSWLLTIGRNCAMRHLRSAPLVDAAEDELEVLAVEAGWGVRLEADPETVAESSERRGALLLALDSLSVEDRSVIVLHDLEELGGSETANVLGLTLPAVKSRLHRARLRLIAALRRLGVSHA